MVRFEVETKSVSHEDMKFKDGGTCEFEDNARPQYINRQGMTKLFFTYSVEWKQSDVRWASRWDSYLAMSDVQIHWFSIVNSVIVVFFLSGILTMVIIRTLRRDIAKYVAIDSFQKDKLAQFFDCHFGTLFSPGITKTMATMRRWRNPAGNLFTGMFSDRRDIPNSSPLSSAAGSKFSAWLSSRSVRHVLDEICWSFIIDIL